jgi:hypothetical protein
MRLAYGAAARIELDLRSLREQLVGRRRRSRGRGDFVELERDAREALEELWEDGLGAASLEALERLREFHVGEVGHVASAIRELEAHGRDAWIATAIVADAAAQLAFDVLDDLGELMRLD